MCVGYVETILLTTYLNKDKGNTEGIETPHATLMILYNTNEATWKEKSFEPAYYNNLKIKSEPKFLQTVEKVKKNAF